MMFKPNVLKISALILASSVLGISSCQEDEPDRLTLQDTADISDEAITDSYFEDVDDMAGVALGTPSDTEYSGGRTSGSFTIEDHRFACEGIVVTIESAQTSNTDVPKGVLTIDFGSAGCTDQRGNVRKGKLIFTYNGRRFMPESTVVTTTENYSINGVVLEGTRTLTNLQNSTSEAPRFNATLVNGKAIFENELTATRESSITWQLNRADNPINDFREIESTSTASGTTRGGRDYEITILEPLIYKRHCGIAVSGIKKHVIDGVREIVVDYGDGECDRTFTVTVNGRVRQVTL